MGEEDGTSSGTVQLVQKEGWRGRREWGGAQSVGWEQEVREGRLYIRGVVVRG